MSKSNPGIILMVIIALAAIWAINNPNLQSTIGFDDYPTYEDYELGYQTQDRWIAKTICTNGAFQCANPTEAISSDGLRFNLKGPNSNDYNSISTIDYSKDFLNSDVKIAGSTTMISASAQIKVNSHFFNIVPKYSGETRRTSVASDFVLEIKHSKLNYSNYEVLINGISQGIFNDGDSIRIALVLDVIGGTGYAQQFPGEATLALKTVKIKLPLSCQKGSQDLLGFETFPAGQSISLYSTRYAVKSFCLEHPAIITKAEGSTTTAEIYNKLVSGEVMTVPSGETWTLFYIFYNDGSIPMTCQSEQFDVANNRCQNVSGITYFCSAGTFDPSIGTCTVTADSITVCEVGRYDVAQQKCIWNPPIQALCPPNSDYNSVSGKCEFRPLNATVCSSGFEYNPLTRLCEAYPLKTIICEEGYTYNPLSDKCERKPLNTELCDAAYTYNPSTGKCERILSPTDICVGGEVINDKCVREISPEEVCVGGQIIGGKCVKEILPSEVCVGGEFTNGRCIREVNAETICQGGTFVNGSCIKVVSPDVENICTLGTLYKNAQGVYTCVFEPPLNKICVQGTYDAKLDACVLTPNLQYLCINGVYNATSNSCVITPSEKILCRANYIYDVASNKCIFNPNEEIKCADGTIYDSSIKKCVLTPDNVINCDSGFNYNSVSQKCEKGMISQLPQRGISPVLVISLIVIAIIVIILSLSKKK